MGLFDDLSQFLETRLEEFLRSHPQLELMALDDQLQEQEEDTRKLLVDLRRQETALQEQIMATAQEVKLWHIRIDKAKAAGRLDLAEPAQEREAALLREGNQLWGQMRGVQERIKKTEELYRQVQARRQEVQRKLKEVKAAEAASQAQDTSRETAGWYQASHYRPRSPADPLEQKFRQWEMDDEIEQLKRQMGR
ncbi:MAG: TIGR04376 family protein [Cyanobacteria bacterium]|nr:TIGR04376 family protein [Cyanobacteriota bacterium]MDW8199824.1 TIGR04376 family protein [Cyanobacteriota bacterium SKYGB_h_bin112]